MDRFTKKKVEFGYMLDEYLDLFNGSLKDFSFDWETLTPRDVSLMRAIIKAINAWTSTMPVPAIELPMLAAPVIPGVDPMPAPVVELPMPAAPAIEFPMPASAIEPSMPAPAVEPLMPVAPAIEFPYACSINHVCTIHTCNHICEDFIRASLTSNQPRRNSY